MFVAHPVTLLYAAICWQGKVTRFNTSLTVAVSLLVHFMLIRFVFIVADFKALEILVFFQQDAGSLPTMNGLRRQPTCWAAPWRSFPPPSSSIRPRAPCPEPAPSARLPRKMAQQMQVLSRIHFPVYSFHSPASLCHSLSTSSHTRMLARICACSSPKGNCMHGRKM